MSSPAAHTFRNTGLDPTLFGLIDARICPCVLLVIFMQNLASAVFCLVLFLFFCITNYFGVSPAIFLDAVRASLAGNLRTWETPWTLGMR